jgi:homoserine O-acetyltransferase
MIQRLWLVVLLLAAIRGRAAEYPPPAEGDLVLRDFPFRSGETLPELRIHYRTLGRPEYDAHGVVRNAVLILHGTTGSGAQFIRPEFAGELFGAGQPLDAARFFIVLPDGIGHGQSGKPRDGLHARFPHYGYLDMVEAQYRLLTGGLRVNHLRLVMGTSMGGMHTWLWGELHPGFMDALMPLASLPTQIAGRNRVWRRMIIDAIRFDPAWRNGEYQAEPPSLRTAAEMLYFMSSNPVLRQQESPTLARTDAVLDAFVDAAMKNDDANDVLYAVEASRDYDPAPGLERIQAPLLAVNSADDLINPPELGILQDAIQRVSHGRAVVLPTNAQTRGHGTHTLAAVWKDQLERLLRDSAAPAAAGASAEAGERRLQQLLARLAAALLPGPGDELAFEPVLGRPLRLVEHAEDAGPGQRREAEGRELVRGIVPLGVLRRAVALLLLDELERAVLARIARVEGAGKELHAFGQDLHDRESVVPRRPGVARCLA